jgi:hypothetical protein
MVRGKKLLRSGVPKSVSSRVDRRCGTHLHLPVGHVYLARGGRRGRAPLAARVYLPGMGQERFMGGGGRKYPGY